MFYGLNDFEDYILATSCIICAVIIGAHLGVILARFIIGNAEGK